MLQPAEDALDEIAPPVAAPIQAASSQAVGARGNDRFGLDALKQGLSLGHVVHLTTGNDEARKNLRDTIFERAKELAKQRVAPVAQSMQLEAQGISEKELLERILELAREIERRPRELWR